MKLWTGVLTVIGWPWAWVRRRRIAALPDARIRNELAQLAAIREEMISAGNADMVQWCNGAIFTLCWLSGEPGTVAPSVGIHPFRPLR